MAVYVSQTETATLVLENQSLVVDAKQLQQRGLQIVNVDGTGVEMML